jgi:hypothetical protein
MFSGQLGCGAFRPVKRRMWAIMPKVFYVLLCLVRSCKSLSPRPCSRVFAAVDGTVIVFGWIACITVFALHVSVKSLSLGEAFEATVCKALIRFLVYVSMLAVIILARLYRSGKCNTNLSLDKFSKLALHEGHGKLLVALFPFRSPVVSLSAVSSRSLQSIWCREDGVGFH